MPHYLTLFVFGMAAFTLVEHRARTEKTVDDGSESKATLAPLILFSLLSVVVTALCVRWKYQVSMDVGRHMLLLDLMFGVLMSSLLVHLGQGAGRLQRLLAWHPLVRVGAFSYSLYLIHAPFVALFFRLFKHLTSNPTFQFVLLIIVGSPAIVGLAYLFFLGCERPFMPGRPQTGRQAEIAAAVSPAP